MIERNLPNDIKRFIVNSVQVELKALLKQEDKQYIERLLDIFLTNLNDQIPGNYCNWLMEQFSINQLQYRNDELFSAILNVLKKQAHEPFYGINQMQSSYNKYEKELKKIKNEYFINEQKLIEKHGKNTDRYNMERIQLYFNYKCTSQKLIFNLDKVCNDEIFPDTFGNSPTNIKVVEQLKREKEEELFEIEKDNKYQINEIVRIAKAKFKGYKPEIEKCEQEAKENLNQFYNELDKLYKSDINGSEQVKNQYKKINQQIYSLKNIKQDKSMADKIDKRITAPTKSLWEKITSFFGELGDKIENFFSNLFQRKDQVKVFQKSDSSYENHQPVQQPVVKQMDVQQTMVVPTYHPYGTPIKSMGPQLNFERDNNCQDGPKKQEGNVFKFADDSPVSRD